MGILKNKKLFLLDMDGTLYIDKYLFERTPEFLHQVKKNGGNYAYLTNNSSRGKDAYVKRMQNFGIEASEADFLTSVDATVDYLKSNYPPETKYFVCGTKTFCKQFTDAGFNFITKLTDEMRANLRTEGFPDVAVLSYNTEITYEEIEDFTRVLVAGKEYIATHPDMLCPSAYGMAVDIGCYIEMFEHASGRTPKIIGKPQPQMALTAMKLFGAAPEETCIIGDRLHTDILCGINAGIDSILVLTGDHKRRDIKRLGINPTYVFNDIGEVCDEIK